LLKGDGSAWVCTFDDEFDGTTLDRTKWFVQTTAASGFHSGSECFVDSSNNIALSGGTLKLTVRKESVPFTCKTPSGGYSTQYTSGTVNGYGRFAQTYGRFEVRAKLPSTKVPGLQETLWLWPVNAYKYGLWPASGEIDFAEVYSQYAGWNIPYLHYHQATSASWSTNTNVYTAYPYPNNQPGMTCNFDPSAFNDYTVVWEPGRITLQVNHKNCIVDNYSATGLTSPAPFDQPFFIALTQALGIGTGNAFVAGTTPLPATTEIDYVRIWK
jgi:beta-glucanase (GH16 family)